VTFTARVAAATAASKPGVLTRPSTITLPPAPAWTGGESSASAASASTSGGVSSISTATCSARSSAASRDGATTAAIGSPTNRTTSVARTGWAIGT
jgi:hypothetical protein